MLKFSSFTHLCYICSGGLIQPLRFTTSSREELLQVVKHQAP